MVLPNSPAYGLSHLAHIGRSGPWPTVGRRGWPYRTSASAWIQAAAWAARLLIISADQERLPPLYTSRYVIVVAVSGQFLVAVSGGSAGRQEQAFTACYCWMA
jgi:hypothetical protein